MRCLQWFADLPLTIIATSSLLAGLVLISTEAAGWKDGTSGSTNDYSRSGADLRLGGTTDRCGVDDELVAKTPRRDRFSGDQTHIWRR